MALAYNGQNQQVKIGKQTVQGTMAGALVPLNCKAVTAGLAFDSIKYENSTGGRVGGKDKIGGQSGKLSIPAQLEAKTNGHILAAAFGTDNTTIILASKVFKHTFTVQPASVPRFYSVQIGQDAKYCTQILDAVCQSLNLEFAPGSYVTLGSDWVYSDDSEIAPPAYVPVAPVAIVAQAGTISIAGSAPEELAAFSLNLNNNTKADKKGLNNAGKPIAIMHGNAEITGEFSVVYNDNTLHLLTKHKAATEFALAVSIDSGEVIDTVHNFKFGLDAGKVVLTEVTKSMDQPMMLECSFKVCDTGSAATTCAAWIQNGDAVAY